MRPGTMKFKLYGTLFGFLAFGASFVGFTDLVNILYPITGLIGFILMGAITIKAISRKKQPTFQLKSLMYRTRSSKTFGGP
ncbi:hypothetical protein JCM19055_997 [Geomicrobium sp. JCM 19055]|nr:hypothetical protein JCM19055_997 [Geomicrobium sp. JCM 19055]